MAVTFEYAIVDRKTGEQVTRNVATLACADAPAEPAPSKDPTTVTVSHGDDADSTPSAPRTRDFAFDSMFEFGFGLSGNTFSVENAGLRVGLGRRFSERWYLGASTRGSVAMAVSRASGATLELQLGPEARFAYHVGANTGGWLGLRVGIDRGNGPALPDGTFAELEWGPELRMDNVQLGMLVALGATRADEGPRGGEVGGYSTFAFRFGLDL
jgi:hypothetical protein